MDDSTRFLIERMDKHFELIREEIKLLREEVRQIEGFRQKVLGMAAIVGGGMTILTESLMKKLGG